MSIHFPIIAIDGTAASGKGTVARRLATHFGFAYLDTGLLYRAVGWAVLQAGQDPQNESEAEKAAYALNAETLEKWGSDPCLRQNEVSRAASLVAAQPKVRSALLKFQKNFCLSPPHGQKGAVLDGRDIGTVIAPEAPVKIYITANIEVRAERRFKELQKEAKNASYAAVLADMKERDARDAERSVAPAKPAADAVIVDTTSMTADEVFDKALSIAKGKLNS